MRSCQATLKPLFRSLAVLTLAVFVAAEVMCFLHCHLGGGHGDAGEPSCHSTASTHAGHDEDSSRPPTPSTSCVTLQNLLTSTSTVVLIVPEFSELYTLPPLALALDAMATEPTAPVSRQAWRWDWVFTPEVSLGPAFRSLAPPFLC
jgi:hypothetical protein